MATYLSAQGDCTLVSIRVQPRSARSELAGERDGRLLVRVNAPPVEGAANDAVCKLLAEIAGVPTRAVTVARGQRARDKLIRIEGIGVEELVAKLTAGPG